MSMVDLQKLYFSLVEKGKTQYRIGAMPCAKWLLEGASNAKAVKFTRSLIIYYDSKRGYQIVNFNRFCNGQLVPR